MAVLTSADRKRMKPTIVVNGKGKFFMPDKAHARNALARLNQAKPQLTPAQKARVRARARRILGHKTASM